MLANDVMIEVTGHQYSEGAFNTSIHSIDKSIASFTYTVKSLAGGYRYTFSDGSIGEVWYNGGKRGQDWTYLIPRTKMNDREFIDDIIARLVNRFSMNAPTRGTNHTLTTAEFKHAKRARIEETVTRLYRLLPARYTHVDVYSPTGDLLYRVDLNAVTLKPAVKLKRSPDGHTIEGDEE